MNEETNSDLISLVFDGAGLARTYARRETSSSRGNKPSSSLVLQVEIFFFFFLFSLFCEKTSNLLIYYKTCI